MEKKIINWNDSNSRSILLQEYVDAIRPTDRLAEDDFRPVLMGLFGEVGSIMAPAKKLHREKEAYLGYQAAVEEEFGDTLWYLTALARRVGQNMPDLVSRVAEKEGYSRVVAASEELSGPLIYISSPNQLRELDEALLDLGKDAANLLEIREAGEKTTDLLEAFIRTYFQALHAAKVTFANVVRRNMLKTTGRFIEPNLSQLSTFDSKFGVDEQLPERFEIEIRQRSSGQTWLRWNGVFIGDPLTDNIRDPDGYRFHDVFHFSHAAVLNWSPTFRSLIKHKRKSNKIIDEAQDGGRAIVVEEGLTAWLFSRAKEINFFEHQKTVSLDILKVISQFVQGYEVQECPLKLWENAILQGYAVFRQIHANNGGIVVGDRISRMLTYRHLDGG